MSHSETDGREVNLDFCVILDARVVVVVDRDNTGGVINGYKLGPNVVRACFIQGFMLLVPKLIPSDVASRRLRYRKPRSEIANLVVGIQLPPWIEVCWLSIF